MADNKSKAVDAAKVPVVGDGEVVTEAPAKSGSGETSGSVNPELDAKAVTVNGERYVSGQQYNLKNGLFDLKDADGKAYFVKNNG